MKIETFITLFAILFIFTAAALSAPVTVALDTDMGPDCDDAGALAILHAMADRGEVQILGIASCSSSEWSAPCIDAFNTYHGRPDIPVATLKEDGFLADSSCEQYNKYIAQNFPNRLKSGHNAPDAVRMYREILTSRPDASITFLTIGPLRNIKNFLNSTADDLSPLNGIELAAKKVKQLVCMGGAYPKGNEWNFNQDVEATKVFLEKWPTPIVFSGYEIGTPIMTGKLLRTQTPETNPVRKAYQLYSGTQADGSRNSWDLTAALYAVRGAGEYWTLRSGGHVEIDANGNDQWMTDSDRNHSYLVRKMRTTDLAKVLEDLMIQPPSSECRNSERLK